MKLKWKLSGAAIVAAVLLASNGQLQGLLNSGLVHAAASTGSGSGNAQIEYAFTQAGQHPEKMLDGVIDGAKKTLDISIYSLTEKSIVSAIVNAKKRGVVVRVISDKQEVEGKAQAAAMKKLVKAGIPIKINTFSGLMHEKVTVADGAVVTTGSFNYSAAASTKNDEVLVVIRDAKIAQDWTQEFEVMWNDTQRYRDYSV
ncbi:phospholipase D-like domain-containing protein [Cohnella soli]|uniref:phospholipase D n=1 Tax=Cohnella soli TaxID=425005 RepID=A0ABW0HMV7_9BACL